MGASSHETQVRRRHPVADGELVTVVVEYPSGEDRCTIYPAELTETERLTCWLSADVRSFECLERRR